MVLTAPVDVPAVPGLRVEVLDADDPELPRVLAAVQAGFSGRDEVASTADEAVSAGSTRELLRAGLVVTVGAFDDEGVLGGGSHSPRGQVTELAGISVLPRARRRGVGAAITSALVADARSRELQTVFLSAADPAVARLYARLGFTPVGTVGTATEPHQRE